MKRVFLEYLVNILKYLKPPECQQEIEDPQEIQKKYKYWRLRIFYSIYIGYVFYYLTRRSFASVMPYLIGDLGFEKTELGILGSVFSISYGLSKFLSGGMADRMNPRYFMAFGLMLTGVANIFFGLSSSLTIFALFWGLNGWFQGWGAPPCARLLSYWYSHKERGSWWGVWNTSHSLGGFIIPFIVVGCNYWFGWRSALFIPGFVCIIAGFFLINRLRDTPQSLGLPSIEKYKNDFSSPITKVNENLSIKDLLFTYVLSNKLIWLLGVAYFFVYIIRMAISDWGILFLMESKQYSALAANTAVAFLEAGGVVGSLVAGWVSDKI
ncbi:MAG: MFS transporter, partial [Verrucomicrobia bacterium]|nr:MFS transporter [Verrucomicrobiota bacterium]